MLPLSSSRPWHLACSCSRAKRRFMLDTIKKHLAAFSSSSWTDYRATLSSDAIYEEVASSERVVGMDRFVTAVQRWKNAFPDMKATITRGYTVGDRVIVEVEWEG